VTDALRAWRVVERPALMTAVPSLAIAARCGGCGAPLSLAGAPLDAAWCVHCRDRWGPPPGGWPAGGGCAGWAAAAYRGPIRRAILVAKRGAPAAATSLLLRRLPPGLVPPGAVVTWVPGHPLRTITAPDSGRVFAEALAHREEVEARPLLRRSPLGRRQAGRTEDDRRRDPARLGLRVTGRVPESVVIVDDVRTTGTTLDHAARLLRGAGASRVFAIAVAAAPSLLER
jgi:predicted amidophosphoribosyltransferase